MTIKELIRLDLNCDFDLRIENDKVLIFTSLGQVKEYSIDGYNNYITKLIVKRDFLIEYFKDIVESE